MCVYVVDVLLPVVYVLLCTLENGCCTIHIFPTFSKTILHQQQQQQQQQKQHRPPHMHLTRDVRVLVGPFVYREFMKNTKHKHINLIVSCVHCISNTVLINMLKVCIASLSLWEQCSNVFWKTK